MLYKVHKLKEGCPNEMDVREIVYLSKRFLTRIDFDDTYGLNEIKVRVQEAKDILFQIVFLLSTSISRITELNKSDLALGFQLKFEEDVAAVLGNIKEKHESLKIESVFGIMHFLRYAGELKSAYFSLIYYPMIFANRTWDKKDRNVYMHILFTNIRNNASIIGHSDRLSALQNQMPSRIIIPNPARALAQNIYGTKHDMVKDISMADGVELESLRDINFEDEWVEGEHNQETDGHNLSEPKEEIDYDKMDI